ncbi:MAG: hypothetical protein JWP01_3242 [Myxococcales bacterium]|nr:hypothetical protein [Myxococcales bacterium]
MRWPHAVVLALAMLARDTGAERTLPDYRYFRALSIDVVGRPPTRAELAEFEQPTFNLDKWLDTRLGGPAYVERIRRIYADLLRLELPENSAVFRPPSILLQWTTIQDPDGKTVSLYFRDAQRRAKPEIDGQVCFTPAEIGVTVGPEGNHSGTPKPVSKKLLDERTVVVKPWWLYADYKDKQPRDRAEPGWVQRFGYELTWSLFTEPDGKTPTTGVRVCREEAQLPATGRVYATGRDSKKGDPIPSGRTTRLPGDTAFARANAGRLTSCTAQTGYESSVECGCGIGLERCLPTSPGGFVMPWITPLGVNQPFDSAPRPAALWLRAWWSQEAIHFLDRIFQDDRDVREILISPSTMVNGPLAQFYRFFANATCCGAAAELGYSKAEPLFDPATVPTLAPYEVSNWKVVEDRGPHAAGVLTMPMFLLKYGSRRQRAHVVYNAFMCKEFVAETVKLAPSTEPDLTKRAGCASCHKRLEPMSAYFARIQESDWTYLPASHLPVSLDRCTAGGPAGMPMGACRTFYDADFTTRTSTVLRGAYSAPSHADEGPRGLAREVTSSPEFAPCVVRNVAQSLLGRQLTVEDEAWKTALADRFRDGGFRMRSLVRSILTSTQYRHANDRAPRAE